MGEKIGAERVQHIKLNWCRAKPEIRGVTSIHNI